MKPRREFQSEVDVDPSNASAQFVLGELARRAGDWNEAIARFSQAAKLDAGFSEAYLALGMSLAASGQFSQAISPLETYVKLQPEDPAGHYQLAIAYSRTGNKDAATREMAVAGAGRRAASNPRLIRPKDIPFIHDLPAASLDAARCADSPGKT